MVAPLSDRDLVDAWRELAASAPPVLAADFFLATARWLARGRPLLAAAHAGKELRAALPLCQRGFELHALESEHTPRLDLVGDPDAIPALWDALADQRGWHVLSLPRVPADGPLAIDLCERARRTGYRVAIRPGARSPYLPLAKFERSLSGRFRRKLRGRARRLGEHGFERIAGWDAAAIDEAFALEAAAWKADAGTAIVSDPRLRGFYRELAASFARRGQLCLAFLTAGGRRIAAHFALDDGETYYLLKPGYDPAYARFGPGHLLIEKVAADAVGRGLRGLDFLGTDMAWKLEWTDEVKQHVNVRIYRPTPLGRLLYAAEQWARPAAGRLLRRLGRRAAFTPRRTRHG